MRPRFGNQKVLGLLLLLGGCVTLLFAGSWLWKRYVGGIQPAWFFAENTPGAPTASPTTLPSTTGESITLASPIGDRLQTPSGWNIGVFANGISGARDLVFSPGGTLLASQPGEGKVVALPASDNLTQAATPVTVVENLDRPHGLAFHDGQLFVAAETAVYRYDWNETDLTATDQALLFELPAGGRHWSRTIVFDDQDRLFISLGSTCDTCVEENPWHGSVIVTDADGQSPRVFSTGLRNAVFMTRHPQTGAIWTTEMGRDFLGDELPPDEINVLTDGAHFGWPFCYGNQVYDERFGQRTTDFCAQTVAPVYEIPAHSAPLGLTFFESPLLCLRSGKATSWWPTTALGTAVSPVATRSSGSHLTTSKT